MKSWLKHALVLLGFVVATMVYFSAKFDGKVLMQSDIQKWEGMIKEQMDYHEKEGGESVWCSSMFSGMPAYTIGNPSSVVSGIKVITSVFKSFGEKDAGIVLCMLCCMYALLISLGCGIWTSVFGAVAFAFSSYSLIIIAAGHVSKGWSMAYMPLTLCGMQLIMNRKKYILGGLVFALGFTLLVAHGHYQIVYYFAILALVVFLAWVVMQIIGKDYNSILRSTGVMAIGCVLGVLICSADLYSHYEVGKTSIRGRSELTADVDGKSETKSSGLDRDYAFAWSYGIGETMTILIPNYMGGESGGTLDRRNSHLAKAYSKHHYQVPERLQTYTYWGDQTFTSGPVYFGAIVCFLTLLALVYVRNVWTWIIFGASLFFFVLSFGHNMSINNFFFDALPMYNKFRTPSMALIIPQMTFALLGAFALKKYVDSKSDDKFTLYLGVATTITAGFCFLMWVAPDMFGLSFKCASDADYGLPDWYMDALVKDRKDLLSSDAFRSMMFILCAAALLWVCSMEKFSKFKKYAALSVAVLTFLDLWNVDQRYLNDRKFTKVKSSKNVVKPTEADKEIMRDKDLDYRVLTLNNPFNDTRVSYFHHSIGGYNAAKNRRYQDLIEQKLQGEISYLQMVLPKVSSQSELDSVFARTTALNMLNMKYVLDAGSRPVLNTQANGTAWFVSSLLEAKSADDEMKLVKKENTKSVAIVSSEQMKLVEGTKLPTDGKIELVYSRPNIKKFKTSTSDDAVAVFSDVYYQPGWVAKIDGKEVDHVRANWILRAMKVPAGNHEIEFTFYPKTYYTLRNVGVAASWLLVLSILGLLGWYVYKENKGKKKTSVA